MHAHSHETETRHWKDFWGQRRAPGRVDQVVQVPVEDGEAEENEGKHASPVDCGSVTSCRQFTNLSWLSRLDSSTQLLQYKCACEEDPAQEQSNGSHLKAFFRNCGLITCLMLLVYILEVSCFPTLQLGGQTRNLETLENWSQMTRHSSPAES